MTVLNNFVTSITQNRANWPTLVNPLTLDDIDWSAGQPLQVPVPLQQDTGLSPLSEFKLTGDNQTKTTRWPQGVATYVDDSNIEYILTSWYFSSSSNNGNCKLVLINPEADMGAPVDGSAMDVCPCVVNGSGEFVHFNSHAGGMAVIGNYLYISCSDSQSIRVFDLTHIYKRVDNLSAVSSSDSFINLYPYILPQVGQIFCSTPGNANLSYMSVTQDGGSFLLGNFYSTTSVGWSKGGKGMIWLVPIVEDSGIEFPAADATENQAVEMLEPLFPSGPNVGTTMTRLQGALLVYDDNEDRILILQRSYVDSSNQLIVMNLGTGDFFSGDIIAPLAHNATNWLHRCEDLTLAAPSRLLTITEDPTERSVTFWDLDDILSLL